MPGTEAAASESSSRRTSPVTIGGTDPNARQRRRRNGPSASRSHCHGDDRSRATSSASTRHRRESSRAARRGIDVAGPRRQHVGGTGPGEGNVIGGFDYGMMFEPADPVFQGNFIGTDTTATKNFGNRIMGIFVGTHASDDRRDRRRARPTSSPTTAGSASSWRLRDPRTPSAETGSSTTASAASIRTASGWRSICNFNSTPSGPNPNDPGDVDDTEFGNEFQNYPLHHVGRPGGRRHAHHRNAQQPRVDHFRPRLLREPVLSRPPARAAAGRDLHRLDPGDDRRLGQCVASTCSSRLPSRPAPR